MKPESEVSQEIQIESPHYNCILMRNNSGALEDKEGRTVRFGLGNISKQQNEKLKSSDLIGFTKVLITPEMVGQSVAIFTAIEVKREDWNPEKKLDKREKAQLAFITWVKNQGGVAAFCNSVDKLKDIFKH